MLFINMIECNIEEEKKGNEANSNEISLEHQFSMFSNISFRFIHFNLYFLDWRLIDWFCDSVSAIWKCDFRIILDFGISICKINCVNVFVVDKFLLSGLIQVTWWKKIETKVFRFIKHLLYHDIPNNS